MKLEFRNNNGDIYDLSTSIENYQYSISSYSRRLNVISRFSKPGGKVSGDEKVGVRDILIRFPIAVTSDSAYLAIINGITGFLHPDDGPFYLVDTDNNRRCLIRYNNGEDISNDGQVYRVAVADTITLKALDSHWEDLDANFAYSETGGISTGQTISINNSGEEDSYPIIRISPLANNSDFTLTNTTLGISCRIGTNAFVIGSTITIDCTNGQFLLESGGLSTDISEFVFTGTGPIRFKRGTNLLKYESIHGAAEIEIEYRRWWPW